MKLNLFTSIFCAVLLSACSSDATPQTGHGKGHKRPTPSPPPVPSLRTPTPTPTATPVNTPTPTPTTTPTPTPPGFAAPRGVYDMAGITAPDPDVLADPDVPGISLGMHWDILEPTEGNFDWDFLDTQIAAVAGAGKKCLIRVNIGGIHKPAFVLAAAGSDTYTFLDNSGGGSGETTIPVLWNQAFLDKYKNMIQALATRFAGNSAVKIIVIGYATAVSMDYAIPDNNTVDGILPAGSTEVSRWMAAGYTHAKMVGAAAQIIDKAATVFPNQAIYFSIGQTKSLTMEPNGSWALPTEVVANARTKWGNRVFVGHSAFNAITGPNTFETGHPPFSGQALWKVHGDPTWKMLRGSNPNNLTEDQILRQFFDKVGAAKWMEVYETDCKNLTDAVAYGNGRLTQ